MNHTLLIEKLAGQACGYIPGPGEVFMFDDHELTEFAALIVKECITYCEYIKQVSNQSAGGLQQQVAETTAQNCANMIRIGFGLE